MDIALESLEGLQRQLRVTIPAITLEQRLDSRLAEVATQSKIPGFRPGKAPLSVLRQRYGQELREELIEQLLKEALAKAEKEQKLRIAGGIRVEAPSLLAALPTYTYVLHFEVFPEIPDLDLSQVTVTVPQVSIEAHDIDERLRTLQQAYADWQVVKRDSKEGDKISFEYQIFDHGKLLDSGQKKNFFLGQDHFFTESLSKSLLGMRAKEGKVLDVTLPDTLSDIDQALLGKSLRLHLTMQEVAMAQLPPLDDALAQRENYENLEELRAAIREYLQSEAEMAIVSYVDDQFFHTLDMMVDFPLPPSLVAEQMQALFKRQPDCNVDFVGELPREEAEVFFDPACLEVKERLLLEKLGEQLQVVFDQQGFAEGLPYMLPDNLGEERIKMLLEDKGVIGVLAQNFYLRQVKIAALLQVKQQTIAMSFEQLLNAEAFAQLTAAEVLSDDLPMISTEEHPNDKND